jgi:hypothetical protein
MLAARRHVTHYLLLGILVGCSGAPPSTPGTDAPSAVAAVTTAQTATPASVICEAFVVGGPVDRTSDAVIENLQGGNPAQATREAITGYEEIAERASGEERDDLLALADAMDQAAMSGEGVNGWNAASEAFYVKYAEECGREIAP